MESPSSKVIDLVLDRPSQVDREESFKYITGIAWHFMVKLYIQPVRQNVPGRLLESPTKYNIKGWFV